MCGELNLDEIREGFEIPELTVSADRRRLFMYSAVTWNRHLIHYSKQDAQREGLPDVVVHRGLIGNFMVRQLQKWIGSSGEIVSIGWKMKSSAFPDELLTCKGSVSGKTMSAEAAILECALEVVNDKGALISVGSAAIRFVRN